MHGASTKQADPRSSTSAPTPRPWTAKGAYVFAGNDCIAICDTDNASERRYEANARLIAAAPDMLALLEFIASGLERKKIKDASVVLHGQSDLTTLSAIVRSALSKAKAVEERGGRDD